MPDLSFASFNARSFEQLAQALSAKVLGPGAMIFGDGPDGGREASYKGTVPYPNVTSPWSGHVVMQAKFRQREESGTDADWLARQLTTELERYADPSAQRLLPNYYILVSNVRLSSIEGTRRKGGQQKVQEVFERLGAPLGIKELHVWHADKLSVLLDDAPDILRSYEGWLGPREVLSSAFRYFQARTPDFGATMTRYLQRELRTQRETRLQQAGHVGDGGSNLEDLFVDLPCEGDALDPAQRAQTAVTTVTESVPLALATLLDRFAVRLAPSAAQKRNENDRASPTPARQILIGGPGQGKSTISQFAGQIMRWRLLEGDPLVSPDVSLVLRSVAEGAARMRIPLEGVRRYPVRVDLPAFADELDRAGSRGERLSLLAHIARHIGSVADGHVGIEDMRGWLGAFPWLVLLDGLDEVPDSGNRAGVLRAINEFWDEATPLDADVAMVVTTRPQGYNDDLDPRSHLKLELIRLDTGHALAYAERLAALKLGDQERRARVLARLAEAAANPTTSLLMISPLQVAILFQLVDQRGQAPTDRWTLFDDYLDVVMKREQEKPGPGGEVVRSRERSIRNLLRQAGLLLHVDAERDGAAASFVTPEQLRRLVGDVLAEEGHEAEDVDRIAAEVVTAATDRLVFLEQRAEGQIAFEVRSLQEYAAAAALMSGREGLVQDRLRTIAGHVHWQHVYRIAASKAFSDNDAEHFRDTILAINRELDDADLGSKTIRRGAEISLDLLEDGLAADQPRYRRALAAHALDTLKLGPEEAGERLADVLAELGEAFSRVELGSRSASGERQERIASWRLIVALVDLDLGWADDFAIRSWPRDGDRAAEALLCGAVPGTGTRLFDRFRRAIGEARPAVLLSELNRRNQSTSHQAADSIKEAFAAIRSLSEGGRDSEKLEVGLFAPATSHLRFITTSIDRPPPRWVTEPPTNRWTASKAVQAFIEQPSCDALATFARGLSDSQLLEDLRALPLPWPLETLTLLADRGMTTGQLEDRAANGGFGDFEGWRTAEKRLVDAGLQEADLAIWQTGQFFDERIASAGAPHFRSISRSHPRPTSMSWLAKLASAGARMQPGQPANLVRFVVRACTADGGVETTSPDVLMKLALDPAHEGLFSPELLSLVDPVQLAGADVIASLAERGQGGLLRVGNMKSSKPIDEELIRLAISERMPGLLPAVVAAMAARPADLFAKATDLRDLAFALRDDLHRPVRESAALVLMMTGDLDGMEVVQSLFDGEDDSVERHAAFKLAESGALPEKVAQKVFALAVPAFEAASGKVRADAIRALRRLHNGRPSGIADTARWIALGLPSKLQMRLQEHKAETI
jgi:hypothetical protein